MYNNPHPQDPQYQQYNNNYQHPQQGGIPMQQYQPQPAIHYDPVITPQHAMSPMGASPASSSPQMNDPMIDGLSFFPALVVKQKRNSLWEYICNCEEENVSNAFFYFTTILFFLFLVQNNFYNEKKYAIFNPAGNSKESKCNLL